MFSGISDYDFFTQVFTVFEINHGKDNKANKKS